MIYGEIIDILKEYDFKVNEYEEIKGTELIENINSITF